MKKTFTIFYFIIGLVYVGIAVLRFFFLESLFVHLLINLFAGFGTFFLQFYKLLPASNPIGKKSYDISSGMKTGAFILLFFSFVCLTLDILWIIPRYSDRFAGNGLYGFAIIAFLACDLIPACFEFKNYKEHSFESTDYSVCPKCYTVSSRYRANLEDKTSSTYVSSNTKREQIGEIRSTDNKQQYDVYGNVTHISVETITKYNYTCLFVCPCCNHKWEKGITSMKKL